MLNIKKDIDSLSNFKRNTSEFVGRMKKTGKPVVLTINGKAELVVQDAASYQHVLETAQRVEDLEVLRKSLEDVSAGRTRPLRQALQSLSKRR